jgi:hypothetical protein
MRVIGFLFCVILTATWMLADGGPDHQATQPRPIQLGTSGGNVNEASRAFCCSGTLGALVTKNTINYILSNNHVLGRSGAAAVGEDISQPGLIDNNCRLPGIVADFSEAAPLGSSNVDAALAQVVDNAVDLTGAILDIGTISGVVAAPSVGLNVMKSGRTTGQTFGTIGSINTDVNVQYQKGCNQGKKFVISYINQIVISGGGFSAGGDSGSLIVTNDACKQPVGLLFAGSSTSTIANPAQDVAGALGVSFVGGSADCSLPPGSTLGGSSGPAQAALDHVRAVKARHSFEVLNTPGILGLGVGAADDNPAEAVLVVYVERGHALPGNIANSVEGVRIKVVNTDAFVAYGNEKWGK